MTEEGHKLTLIEHLTALRSSLIRSAIALTTSTLLCLYFSKEIFRYLQRPLLAVMPGGSGFIATSPLEAMITYLKVSILAGVFLASPFILYQIWRFVAPGLYRKEKTLAGAFVFLSTLFFVGGAMFGYYLIFPVGFKFFVAVLEGTGIQFLPQMTDYLAFISKMLLTFGAVFEMPLVIVLLAKIGIIRHQMLSKARKYVLVLMFLIAGILTPGPDVLSQVLLAVPLLILYELSAVVVWVMEKKEKKEEKT